MVAERVVFWFLLLRSYLHGGHILLYIRASCDFWNFNDAILYPSSPWNHQKQQQLHDERNSNVNVNC